MLVETFELSGLKGKVVMVDGGFDPLHIGHIKYFEEAAKFGLPVLCNVQADKYITGVKHRANVLPEDQRIRVIDSIKHISYVHLCTTSTHDVLEKLKPVKYVKGADWKGRGLPAIEQEICRKNGIEIVYLDTNLDSSTNRYNNMMKNNFSEDVKSFENLVLSQKAVEAKHYDDEYFVGDWRDDHNDYRVETRRAKEGKNPQNIKEVFSPKRALDFGCGPGALMYLLHELGVETYGIDFSKAAKQLAPKEVADKIHIGPVTEFHDFGFKFDLVICREMLEHLTVLQIKKAVELMAKYSSKFVYVTTRFHASPNSLLDVTDDKGTDPTHITLLNKELLRTLFVLEGMKQRPDLEDKLDWKKYGRVLVYEKV